MINNENALKLSNDLLKNNSWKKDDYILACEVLEYHNELYYKKESPIISDKEYDDLFNKLKFFEN